ncbi:MAG: AsmA-like C-terminal region-containing protein [Salibacteraceae bacterium]
MRNVILWFFGVAIALVIGAMAAYLLAKHYEEPVRNYIVKRVNQRLQSPVHVSDINFSFLERFPSASLVMDDVWAEENRIKIGDPDTLFYFQKVFLNLNLFDIFNGNYKINAIEVRNGFMNFLVDKEGYDNYHIWKEGSDTSSFFLELDKVHLENTAFTFVNELRQQRYDLIAYDLFFRGKFSDDNYTMAVFGDGIVHDLSIKETSYLRNRLVDVETDLDIVSSLESYAFKKGSLTIDNELNFSVSGAFVGDGIDLHVKGNELDIIKSLGLIPTQSREALNEYESSGELTFDCTLKGAFGRSENPALEASFSFNNAAISKKNSSWSLTELMGTGTLNNGSRRNFSTVKLVLHDVKGKLNDDAFSADVSIVNFDRPTIDGNAIIKTDLQGLNEFFIIDGLEKAEGKVDISATITAQINDLENPQPQDFLNSKASGFIKVSQANLKLKDDERVYAIDTASFSLANNDLQIERYNGSINNCPIDLSGKAKGFLGYLFTKEGLLDVRGELKTGAIDLNELFLSTSNSTSGVVVAFPNRSRWQMSIISESFQIGSFLAEEVSGNLTMTPFKVEASNLHFLSQSGQVQGQAGVYKFDENQLGIRADFTTVEVDIKEIFTTFHNFDQQFITAEVLEGRLDAEIEFQAFCDSLLTIDQSSIIASANVKIKEGALIQFEPLISIADEVKKKPMLRLFVAVDELKKRLEVVRFATLENDISIRNGMITIPQMEIQSSALNLKINGTHSFDNRIDYSFDFAMNEMLTLKDRTEPYNEFVQRDDAGKTRMYLTMKGTTDDFEVEVERTDIKKSLKEEIDKEKQTVKSLLKEEFGVYARDTSLTPYQPEKKAEVEIEFDPEAKTESDPKSTNNPPEDSKTKEKGLFDKLIKKTETDKKKLKEGDFDDDDF